MDVASYRVAYCHTYSSLSIADCIHNDQTLGHSLGWVYRMSQLRSNSEGSVKSLNLPSLCRTTNIATMAEALRSIATSSSPSKWELPASHLSSDGWGRCRGVKHGEIRPAIDFAIAIKTGRDH